MDKVVHHFDEKYPFLGWPGPAIWITPGQSFAGAGYCGWVLWDTLAKDIQPYSVWRGACCCQNRWWWSVIVSFKIISIKSFISSYICRPIKSQPWFVKSWNKREWLPSPRHGRREGFPHPAMEGGQGRKSPPLPVRTIDKEWKASVSICMIYLFKHFDNKKSICLLNVIWNCCREAQGLACDPQWEGPVCNLLSLRLEVPWEY